MVDKRLKHIIEGLERAGIKKYGRNKTVAEKIGYSVSSVAKVLQGHSPLSDKFVNLVCIEFSIDWHMISNGDKKEISPINKCISCRYWEKWGDVEVSYDGFDTFQMGSCHRHAPRPILAKEITSDEILGELIENYGGVFWPNTKSNDFCGEYRNDFSFG